MKQVGATEEGDISFEEFVYMMTEVADGQQSKGMSLYGYNSVD